MQEAPTLSPPIPPCPRCGSPRAVRNGHLASGSQNHLCPDCGRQFVAAPKKGPVPEATRGLVRRLLAERVSLRGICRATGVSRFWLQRFVNALYREETPPEPGPLKKKGAGS